MPPSDIHRIPSAELANKSVLAIHRFPGGGGFLWAVGVSRDRSPDIRAQTRGVLAVLDGYLKDAGVGRDRIVKAEVVVTDHDNKPAFDEVWASWMPADCGPVRSFVESRMPEGDLIEIIITAVLPG